MTEKATLVKSAMLAIQRYPWEQGVCAQALWELGDETTAIAMAHDAVLRQQPDGRGLAFRGVFEACRYSAGVHGGVSDDVGVVWEVCKEIMTMLENRKKDRKVLFCWF